MFWKPEWNVEVAYSSGKKAFPITYDVGWHCNGHEDEGSKSLTVPKATTTTTNLGIAKILVAKVPGAVEKQL